MSLKGIMMNNRFMLMVISSLIFILSACGGGPSNPPGNNPPANNALAGTYNGEIAETKSDFFSLLTFTVDNAGSLDGTTTAKDVGGAPQGEKGKITGTVKLNSVGIVEANITLESSSLGKFTLEGMTGFYSDMTGDVSMSGGTVRDASGTFIGQGGIITAQKQK